MTNAKNIKTEQQQEEDIYNQLSPKEQHVISSEDPGMIRRFLRASNYNTNKALARIRQTLDWRDSFGVKDIIHAFDTNSGDADTRNNKELREMLREENCTGKCYVRGHDRAGRAVIYMRPGAENTDDEVNQMKHLVYTLERAIAVTQRISKGREHKICLCLDYVNFSLLKAPPLSTSRYVLKILQDYYPERLHQAYCCNPPRVFNVIWNLAQPFLDANTKTKILFPKGRTGIQQLVRANFDDSGELLEPCAGGNATKPFCSNTYLSSPFDSYFDEQQPFKVDTFDHHNANDSSKTISAITSSSSSRGSDTAVIRSHSHYIIRRARSICNGTF